MKIKRFTQIILCMLLVCCIAFPSVACTPKTGEKDNEKDALTVATQELDQMFNPFFSTSGYDSSVVGMTQVSMLSSDKDGNVYVGEDQPTVVKYYSIETTDYRTEEEKNPDYTGEIDVNRYHTTYKFLLKNNIKFSDGKPLTIKDVLFNLYLYLDPSYTGSSTLYSTAIVGLDAYRAQDPNADSSTTQAADNAASLAAGERINNLIAYYYRTTDHPGGDVNGTGSVDENLAKLESDLAIVQRNFREELYSDWNGASSSVADSVKEYTTPAVLKENTKKPAGVSHYTNKITGEEVTSPIEWVTEDWQLFLAREGAITVDYDTDDKDVVVGVNYSNFADMVNAYKSNKENAINSYIFGSLYKDITDQKQKDEIRKTYNNFDELKDFLVCLVFDSKLGGSPDSESGIPVNIFSNIQNILYYWATGTTVRQQFMASALTEYFNNKKKENGGALLVPNISGITHYSVSDTFETGSKTITDKGTEEVGVKRETLDESHEVLEITIKGVDPKAIWNFGFTIAPGHYYSDPTIAQDIDNTATNYTAQDGWAGFDESKGHFGFPFGDANYFSEVVKTRLVPLGAGTYQATTALDYGADIENYADDDYCVVKKENGRWVEKIAKKSTNNGFFGDQIVYYTRNKYFETTGKEVTNAKIKKFRYQVVSSNRLYDAVKTGQVHYADPSAKIETLNEVERDSEALHIGSRMQDNNGYGYIGVNPKYVKDIVIRRCIMTAMNVASCLNFYGSRGAKILYRPMTDQSWAYPEGATSFYVTEDLMTQSGSDMVFSTDKVRDRIKEILKDAGYRENSQKVMYKNLGGTVGNFTCKFTFTVAGSDSDHPAYATMSNAADLLNECGFDVKVVNDAQALSKLASGTLQVWAAAWSSTIDPDMYQVYHKESKATSTLNWGYDEILGLNGKTAVEYSENDAPVGIWSAYDGNTALNADYERALIEELSQIIDEARASNEGGKDSYRAEKYHEALDIVMKLAVELPTYQRKNLYVFRNDIIDESTLLSESEISAYQGPIDKIWNLSFVGNN